MNFGKGLVMLGLLIALMGLIVWGISKMGLPLGKLPGDYRGDSVYFPIVSCLVISVVLTILVNLVLWLMRK